MLLIFIHIFCCFLMTGVIWVIQLVHYPMFSFINENKSENFHHFHQMRITFIVAPLMIIELVSSYSLLQIENQLLYFYLPNFLLLVTWLTTLFISAPLHKKLIKNHDLKLIRTLVLTNWIRTLSWTLRSLIFASFYFSSQII